MTIRLRIADCGLGIADWRWTLGGRRSGDRLLLNPQSAIRNLLVLSQIAG